MLRINISNKGPEFSDPLLLKSNKLLHYDKYDLNLETALDITHRHCYKHIKILHIVLHLKKTSMR